MIGLDAIRALSEEYSHCDRCPVLCESRTAPVFGTGSVTADILYVGEAPSLEEDEQGLPFVGPSGRMLLQLLEKKWPADEELDQIRTIEDNDEYFDRLADYMYDRVFITNSVLCRTEDDRTPSATELKECRERLHQTIYAVDPIIILAGGKTAASNLVGKKVGILDRRGDLMDITIQSPVTGRNIRYAMLPVLDCGFLLRKGDSALVREKKGHTYDTLGDFGYALEIVKTHKRLTRRA